MQREREPVAQHLQPRTRSVALIGVRGYAGGELVRLIEQHPQLSLTAAASRAHAGQPLTTVQPGSVSEIVVSDASPEVMHEIEADIYVLAMPNGVAGEYVNAINQNGGNDEPMIVDLSADFRFDNTWTYGLPQMNAAALAHATRIANPGCYATAMMLALFPIRALLDGTPSCFGISGYSGAGTSPSKRNDPEQLRDTIVPYALVDHVHGREVSRHLEHQVRFTPHVAPFFRGLSMTVHARLKQQISVHDLRDCFVSTYRDDACVKVYDASADAPSARDAADAVHVHIGGFAVSADDPHNVVIVSALDNLLKGAASQAIENINLACGFPHLEGLVRG